MRVAFSANCRLSCSTFASCCSSRHAESTYHPAFGPPGAAFAFTVPRSNLLVTVSSDTSKTAVHPSRFGSGPAHLTCSPPDGGLASGFGTDAVTAENRSRAKGAVGGAFGWHRQVFRTPPS